MSENFTQFAFSPSVKSLQERYGSRDAYARVEQSGDRYYLGPSEIDFIRERDSFYLASVGSQGWPYVQHRGGPRGFLTVLEERTLGFIDYGGNRQFISVGNMRDCARVTLFLMNYPRRQRLKIWAEATWEFASDAPDLIARLGALESSGRPERAIVLKVRGFDWNCPQHITPRYTLDEIRADAALLRQLTSAAPPTGPPDAS